MPYLYDIDDLLDEQIADRDLDAVLDVPGAAAQEEYDRRHGAYYRRAFYKEENE